MNERIGNQPLLHMGAFEAELYWREDDLATLPALPDKEAEKIVTAMDELLFTFCQPGDLLFTRYAIEPAQREYIHQLGFSVYGNVQDLEMDTSKVKDQILAGQDQTMAGINRLSTGKQAGMSARPVSVFQWMEQQDEHLAEQFPLATMTLDPFAWIPHIKEVNQRFGIGYHAPELEVVKRVNTKHYSAQMKQKLNLSGVGVLVESSEELVEKGSEWLNEGSFLIKDNYGVSGKGNMLIDSPELLIRIGHGLHKQEEKGKKVQFLIEKYLQKERDFSCQFYIDAQGNIEMLSVQWLANSQFAYRESLSPDPAFMMRLEQEGYFILMEQIGKELYQDGYFGHVCIDSMVLQDGSLEPMVEINARKSMSLIKHQMDQYLRTYGLVGNMTNYNVSHTGEVSHEQLLHLLEQANLLYLPNRQQGIIPLTSSALHINHRFRNDSKKHKGRIYLSVVASHDYIKQQLLTQFEQLLETNQFSILN